LLAASGLLEHPDRARALIMAGRVLWRDTRGRERKVATAGEPLPRSAQFRIKGVPRPFVSRSGRKLEAALEAFELDVSDAVALDAGIGTGGFSQCLLQRGATRIHGVDVAYGRVALAVRDDPRVVLHERTHIRDVTLETLDEPVDILVADLSFIALRPLLPVFVALLRDPAAGVLLVKPQFELSKAEVADGVVRDDRARWAAVERVEAAAHAVGLDTLGHLESPLPGSHGNREILLGLTRGEQNRFKRKRTANDNRE